MGERLGLLALDAAYLGVGAAILYGLGFARGRGAVRFAGLALLVGWAALGTVASLLLVAGLAATVVELLAAAAVLSAVAVALARRVPAHAPVPTRRAGPSRAETAVAASAVVLLVVFLAALVRRAALAAPSAWDSWAFWVPKAQALVHFGGIDFRPGGFMSFANEDYPPFVPVSYATVFRFAGSVDPTLLPLQNTILAVAFFAALGALLGPHVRPVVLWPSLALLALLPNFGRLVGSTLADEPLSVLVGLAGVCGALWLLGRAPGHAALCGVFLAAAALTKNEGLGFALTLVVLLALGSRGRLRTVGLLALAPVLAVLPWKLWLAAHDVVGARAYRLSDLARPGYLLDRGDRLWTALADVPPYLLDWDRWLLVVPLTLALAALLLPRRPSLSLYVAASLVVAFMGNVTIYWIGRLEVDWYIATSADRTASSIVVFCACLVPLLLEQAVREGDT